jgi:hypothetical protein
MGVLATINKRVDRSAELDVARGCAIKPRQRRVVNSFATHSGKEVPWKRFRSRVGPMPFKHERPDLVPVATAIMVVAIGAFFLWSDLKNDALGSGDGMITSAVVSRAGAIMTPSEPPAHLVVPQTVPSGG